MNQTLRVSSIAEMAWCQLKALYLLKGGELPLTPELIEGEAVHDLLGFNENVQVEGTVGKYQVIGHIDRVTSCGKRKTVWELKTFHNTYPINFLLAPAHLQANLYAFLLPADDYVILVYNPEKETFWGIRSNLDESRAIQDLKETVQLLEEKHAPLPTFFEWKCQKCYLKEVGICVNKTLQPFG